MAKGNDEDPARRLREGKTQRECAHHFGVHEGTISKRVKRLDIAVNRNVALFSAGRIVSQHMDYLQQLAAVSEQTRSLLEDVQTALYGAEHEQVQARTRLRSLVGHKGNISNFLVALQAELRKQLEFYFNVQKELYNIKKVKEFQDVVLERIRAVDPEVAQTIVRELTDLQATRSSLDFEGGTHESQS